MPQSAKQVYETLLKEGALNTLDLRRAAKLANAKESEFNKALEILQADFKILPIGISEAGAWKYSFIYEIVPRHYPELPEQVRKIGEGEARSKLLELYFESVGAAQERDAVKLFGWKKSSWQGQLPAWSRRSGSCKRIITDALRIVLFSRSLLIKS